MSALVTAEDKLDNIVAKLFPYIQKVGPAQMQIILYLKEFPGF